MQCVLLTQQARPVLAAGELRQQQFALLGLRHDFSVWRRVQARRDPFHVEELGIEHGEDEAENEATEIERKNENITGSEANVFPLSLRITQRVLELL